ncbi:MAG: type II toxin-antitoxin system PemK/MazF family toxin [Proteobacteria bacterium]|nr:type II toxin-antitoxin system PemK/MazF family toxin [Pseudomonadota bacterium]
MAATSSTWAPDRGDMIWIDFSPGHGNEMQDVHPMLVFSTRLFNEKTGLVIGLPMSTSAEKNDDNPFAVKYTAKGITGYVLAHMPKSFGWRECHAKPHPWGRAPVKLMEEACELFKDVLGF